MTAKILAGPALTAGLRATFDRMYARKYDGVAKSLGNVMRLGLPSDKLTELYAYYETQPYPERWEKGEHIPTEGTESVAFSVTNRKFAKRIQWSVEDREDNQIGSLQGQAMQGGENFASLPSRIFYEILTSTPDLLPAIPNAPDGVALYSATDGGGGARFGVTGGNIVDTAAVSGTAPTPTEIRTSVFANIQRFKEFQDTKGQPLFSPEMGDGDTYTVYFPVEQIEVMAEALQAATVQSASGNAGVDNTILVVPGLRITAHATSRLTGSTMHWFRTDSEIKAIFEQLRTPMQFAQATQDNSDTTRDVDEEYVQWKTRRGYGVTVPYMATQATFTTI